MIGEDCLVPGNVTVRNLNPADQFHRTNGPDHRPAGGFKLQAS